MSTELKDTMVGYARDAEAPVDLGPVIRAGDRRRRVRAGVAGGVAAATVIALAVCGTQLVGALSDDGTPVAAARNIASYASGSHIYVGGETIDVGDHEIHSYVRADRGFVFSDASGDVYFADGASVEQIGTGVGSKGKLRADDHGSLVAWVDDGPEVPEFVVYDTASMTEVLRTSEGNDVNLGPNFESDLASVVALDGEDLYVINGKGMARIDLTAGRTVQVRTGGVNEYDVADVEKGQMAHDPIDTHRDDVVIGPDLSTKGALIPHRHFLNGASVDLSPDATHITILRDASGGEWMTDVANVRTGKVTRLSLPGYKWSARPVWLDDQALSIVAGRRPSDAPDATVDLLSCEIGTGTCSTVAEDIGDDYQVPNGDDGT